jgi:hypothetical protein
VRSWKFRRPWQRDPRLGFQIMDGTAQVGDQERWSITASGNSKEEMFLSNSERNGFRPRDNSIQTKRLGKSLPDSCREIAIETLLLISQVDNRFRSCPSEWNNSLPSQSVRTPGCFRENKYEENAAAVQRWMSV